MKNFPKIRLIFLLIKQDYNDFDRENVTQKLHITPTETRGPQLSQGILKSNSNNSTEELKGITLIPLSESSYQILKHAYWCFDLYKKSWYLDDVLQNMKTILEGKETQIRNICEEHNLKAELIIRIYAECGNMPEISIINENVKYWAQMGVDICFDFYLD